MNTQRSLLLWPLLYALFYFYGTLFYSDLNFSTFHTLSVDTIDRTSSQRLQNAMQWFDTTTHQATNQTATPKYCIAIVTTLRPQRYLLQTMHALFKSINYVQRLGFSANDIIFAYLITPDEASRSHAPAASN